MDLPTRCHVPQAGRPVHVTRGERLAIRREGDGRDLVFESAEDAYQPPCSGVPQLDGTVVGTGGEVTAVVCEGPPPDVLPPSSAENAGQPRAGHIPEPDEAIMTARGEDPAVGREGDG